MKGSPSIAVVNVDYTEEEWFALPDWKRNEVLRKIRETVKAPGIMPNFKE